MSFSPFLVLQFKKKKFYDLRLFMYAFHPKFPYSFLKMLIYLSVAALGISLVVTIGGYSLAAARGLLIVAASLAAEHRF